MVTPAPMLGELILTRLRQLVLALAQAPDDAVVAGGHMTAEGLHVGLARLLPGGPLGGHLDQVLLASG
jgi:hypothetical protein